MPHHPDIPPDSASRRAFLKRSAALSLAAGATPWALSLAAMGEAAAATATDYKALVCVFLYGGNDYANTLVPYDAASYASYTGFRSALAINRDTLTATVLNPTVPLANARQFALAPGLAPLLPLFNAGQLAVLPNVGTLIQPTTKLQYSKRTVQLPPKLFSHDDQQSFWQASQVEGAQSGWGGRMGDLFQSSNSTSTFTCINVSGNAIFLAGQNATQYQVNSGGSVQIAGIKGNLFSSSACAAALKNLITTPSAHLYENEYARITKRSIDAHDQLSVALAGTTMNTVFPTGNGLADQLKLVAKIIAARNTLGVKRQVFMVAMGGFDTHDSLTSVHPGLMAKLGSAMASFYQATADLGVANSVTTFTGSDFGRTLLANTDGSDHGWGAVQFVQGGAVQGGSFIGPAPVLGNNGADDVGQGRLIPTISVDQMGATLANWFGVSATEQALVFPNLRNFTTRNLGFLG